ncbi:hypothetical protein CUMW_255500 [Citrus unshiu]|uniref:NB-ARC domain-containing protein n=1 Tax=Citrus unshiu TaxID=55188 RepID=A0A2H5QRS7_CITUN|nr:hypothetical protein CUMW_255500 [Citrus unshiu]
MSLAKLRSMSLDRCINLEQLPRLGELPSLESLTVRNMRRLEKVGNEFLGIDESRLLRKDEGKVLGTDRSKSLGIEESKPSKPFVAFPRLKSLEFQKMKGWKEWKYSVTTSTWPHDRLMPHLCSLTIGFCPKLETLPDDYLPQLLDLKIISCPKLEERYKEGTAERGNISHATVNGHACKMYCERYVYHWKILREALPLLKPYKEKENGSFMVSSCWMRAELIEASWEELAPLTFIFYDAHVVLNMGEGFEDVKHQ